MSWTLGMDVYRFPFYQLLPPPPNIINYTHWLTSFIQTDMGNTGEHHSGYEQAFVAVDISADFGFGQVSLTMLTDGVLIGPLHVD